MDGTLEYDIYGHFDEIPCEFCEISFPFQLLYEHQLVCSLNPQVAPAESLAQSSSSSENISVASSNSSIQKKSVHGDTSLQQEILLKAPPSPKKKDAPKSVPKPDPPVQRETAEISISEKIKRDFASNNILNDIIASEQSTLTFENSAMQERAPKLMAFGNQNDINIEKEKPTFKVPSISLFNKDENRDMDILSDSEDAPESLEDFWKRAEIKVSQQLNKVIKL